jgi:pyruvate-formate lyase-activating enzyme
MSSLPVEKKLLDPRKFRDPAVTAKGERRAQVALRALRTLWFNTGTLCNLTCRNCYIESSPTNDRLVYLIAAEVRDYLDEIARDNLPVEEIGFTGGEPFMNPELGEMLRDCLDRGFRVLVLTNAMKPMMKVTETLLAARDRGGDRLIVRVSIDHYTKDMHELERGPRSWAPTLAGLQWLAANGFNVHVAGRSFSGQSESDIRRGFARLFAEQGLALDAADPMRLVVFPEMDTTADVPEITEGCWGILKKSPDAMMCASSRMVVKRKGAERPAVVACTLLPYDAQFELGESLAAAAAGPVSLNHPHCAKFCVLGGGSCTRS